MEVRFAEYALRINHRSMNIFHQSGVYSLPESGEIAEGIAALETV